MITTTHQLTTIVKDEKYRAEFDGQEVYVFDQDNHISFSGSMQESMDIANILISLNAEVNKVKITKEEVA